MMRMMRSGASASLGVALGLRFLLELALLVGAAIVTWNLATGWWRWPAALVAAALVTTVWGLFLSPKAAMPLPDRAALALEAALFVGIGAGLVSVGFAVPALLGVALWVLDRIALALFQG